MGTEAVWIPLVMTALGAGASAYNTDRTAKKQDNQLARQLQRQGSAQQEADAKTAQLIQQRAGSDAEAERAGSLGSFMKNIQAQQANATSGLKTTGAVSDEYTASAADASLGIGEYGGKIADLMSRIDAPGQQRQREANSNLRFGQDIGQIQRRSAGDDFLAQMRLQGIKRNPWVDVAASGLKAGGNAYASGGWGNTASGGGG